MFQSTRNIIILIIIVLIKCPDAQIPMDISTLFWNFVNVFKKILYVSIKQMYLIALQNPLK